MLTLLVLLTFLATSDALARGTRTRSRDSGILARHGAPGDANTIVFGGVKLHPPLSTSLRRLGITEPSPIQRAAISPLCTGLTCILHSQTGSGKTIAYLLPILKRLFASGEAPFAPLQAIIVVPTKELVLQVASDIHALAGLSGDGLDREDGPTGELVNICLTNRNLKAATAPILLGTPLKVLDLLRSLPPQMLTNMNYLVLDEVDRMLQAPSRYATNQDRREARHSARPIDDIVAMLLALRTREQAKDMQVVAASATVGRPLRRELFKLLSGGGGFGDLPVIRPAGAAENGGSSTGRLVGVPPGIEHTLFVCSDDSEPGSQGNLGKQTAVVKDLWVRLRGEAAGSLRGLLFVPRSEDVAQTLGVLRFWGVGEARSLQGSLGLDREESLSLGTYLRGAEESGLGAGAAPRGDADAALLVTAVSGSRGLHVKDVDVVFVLRPPKSMDEYLHIAGRTCREGNRSKVGKVVTLVTLEEFKRMQAWQTPLGITFGAEMG